jgi:Type II intron maturase
VIAATAIPAYQMAALKGVNPDTFRRDDPTYAAALSLKHPGAVLFTYQAEYQGLVNYYLMARNVHALDRYHWVMETSLLKTLANKHKTTTTKIAGKLKAKRDTPTGPMKVIRVVVPRGEGRKPLVAEFGGIPLRKQPVRELVDEPYRVWTLRSDPVKRLLKQECEMCGRTAEELEELGVRLVPTASKLAHIVAHHKRKLASLKPKGRREPPDWAKVMLALRRKTLIVCTECHANIHAGRPCRPRAEVESTETLSDPEKARV